MAKELKAVAQDQPAAERAADQGRASEAAGGGSGQNASAGKPSHSPPLRPGGRFSVQRKAQVVIRLPKGEDLEHLSRELGLTAYTLSQWRDTFVAYGATGLKSRAEEEDPRDELITRLKAKVGELSMATELLEQKIDRLETGRPLPPGRPRP